VETHVAVKPRYSSYSMQVLLIFNVLTVVNLSHHVTSIHKKFV